jgi:hypothetical protein
MGAEALPNRADSLQYVLFGRQHVERGVGKTALTFTAAELFG